MKKTLTMTSFAFAAGIALAGCSAGTGGNNMPGMNHGSTPSSSSGSVVGAAGEHNAADSSFAQMMIPHHAQAIQMSDLVLAKKDIPAPVTALAGRIKAAQGPEIEKMTGWLKAWNEPAEMSGDHTMSGMMGDEDMKELSAAQGPEAARLFLTQMIAHHQGAVVMAQKESADGKNADALKLGSGIVSEQEAEIKEMKELLRSF
ncbi:DUF305 domain-containing protein [Arthrobacter sp. MMS18-M83]|uniref:DUF305 domain-containing protein n=1 Tax=Arthrobacter sp. MMS18-M83 TaxID=2996261 RepID=UPI00227CFE59|nr:DUF305 domain-containing protein [Arthrobacter sp. MMS18-M83]WAH96856.1 DUF305 domain-containing protein [Arthrobacter sp. MMS18-M83]